MKLRIARPEDVGQLVALGRLAHGESRFAQMPYAPEKLQRNLEGLITLQDQRQTHCFFLVENRDGAIIGGLIGALEEFFFTEAKSANSIFLWVNEDYRGSAAAVKLIGAFHAWAKRHGAHEVCIQVSTGVTIARTDRFLRRLGFSQTGGNYRLPIVADFPVTKGNA